MRFGVLGPLLVRDGDSVITVPAARQRALLAALLVRAGTVVSADALAEIVWDGAPPDGAVTTLRSHVMRLRRALGPTAGARVVTRPPGYMVEAGEEEVDLLRFAGLCREGGAAVRAGEWARAWAVLTEALGLWRGEPLADIPSELLRRDEVPGLEQLCLQAEEWRADAGLHLARHDELVPELQWLAGRHPLRERFHAQLMLALGRCGRQAEALQAYERARGVLAEELGAEPGPELRELHQLMLIGDPMLTPTRPAPGGPGTIIPRELPAPVPHFVGRANEVETLTALLDRSGEQAPGTIVISAIGGTAGVGKTALAVYWAHQVAERFPDGQLYANLRGYDPDQPMAAADVLAGFLRALGLAGQDIPADEAERAARYRSLLAGRRILVVLDNAGSSEQVRPLLPGSPACAAVVTSRDALIGLVARDGARRLDLDLLPIEDALGLLRALIGTRVDADPEAATALVGRCCRLPLALRVAAELAVSRPAAPLADLASELADQQRSLDLLEADRDRQTAVRTVFSWSYRHLGPGAARMFRLLGLHPGADLEPYAAAALGGLDAGQARQLLDQLARAHLVQPAAAGRYGMHDLLRAYACEHAVGQDSEQERQAALTRLFDHYLHASAVAMDTLFPAEQDQRPRVVPPSTASPPLASSTQARAWLDAQRAILVAVTVHAAWHGWPGHATSLSATLFRYLDTGCHFPEAITIHGQARRAACRADDRAAEADALMNLAMIDWDQGRCQQGLDRYRKAMALAREAGDQRGEARALASIGDCEVQQGHYDQAAAHLRQALALYRETGTKAGVAAVLGHLAVLERRRGNYEQAVGYLHHVLALHRETGNQTGMAYTLARLGVVDSERGRHLRAIGYLEQAIAVFREFADPGGEARALSRLGVVELRLGRCQLATGHFEQALAMFRDTGDRSGEVLALNGLGEAVAATGQPGQARARHAAALRIADQMSDRFEQARAHNGLGHAHYAVGDRDQARCHWRQSLAAYAELGAPEADQVRAQLAAADDGSHRERRASG